MSEVHDALVRARERIANKARWTQFLLARDLGNFSTSPDDKRAAMWCALGAICVGNRPSVVEQAAEALNAAAITMHPQSKPNTSSAKCATAWVNDHLGHEAVLKVYDAAIEATP